MKSRERKGFDYYVNQYNELYLGGDLFGQTLTLLEQSNYPIDLGLPTKLKGPIISCNGGGEDVRILIDYLNSHPEVTGLNLSGQRFMTGPAIRFILSSCKHLTSVNLSSVTGSLLPRELAQAVAAGIDSNTNLSVITLRDNNLNDACADILSAAIRKNVTLSEIQLGGNPFTVTGRKSLSDAFDATPTLGFLEMTKQVSITFTVNDNHDNPMNMTVDGPMQEPVVLGRDQSEVDEARRNLAAKQMTAKEVMMHALEEEASTALRDGNDDAFGYGGFFHMTALRLMERFDGCNSKEEQKTARPEGKF